MESVSKVLPPSAAMRNFVVYVPSLEMSNEIDLQARDVSGTLEHPGCEKPEGVSA